MENKIRKIPNLCKNDEIENAKMQVHAHLCGCGPKEGRLG